MSSRRDWESFTADNHAVWDLLFARQVELLGGRVVVCRSSTGSTCSGCRTRKPPTSRGWNAIGTTHWLAHGGRSWAGSRSRVLRDAQRTGVPGREFHSKARGTRLSRSARLFPRPVRPYSDARHHDFAEMTRADRRARESAAIAAAKAQAARLYCTASSSGSRWRMAGSRSSVPAWPRATGKRG